MKQSHLARSAARALSSLALVAGLAVATLSPAAPALGQSPCFADYKAMRGTQMQLHYGVMELSGGPCSAEAARDEVARRLAAAGWELLRVLSVFGPEGLAARRADAGAFFLAF